MSARRLLLAALRGRFLGDRQRGAPGVRHELAEEGFVYLREVDGDVPRLILDRDYVGGGSDVYFSPLLARRPCEGADPGTRSFRFTKIGCDETRCIAPWYVALRRDDTLRLETSADYEGLVLVYPQHDAPPFSKEGRGELAKKGWVKRGEAVDFVAPANGWYLLLFSIDGARPEVAYDLCAELIRAR